MMALTHTLLPEPVVPAMSRCGMVARSPATACPDTSCPSAMRSGDLIFWNDSLSSTSRRATVAISPLGTSMPTMVRPGTGASMRIDLGRQRQRQIVGQRA